MFLMSDEEQDDMPIDNIPPRTTDEWVTSNDPIVDQINKKNNGN
tara:strand:+ start:421 stop:552 length:132 start_codon:yes stop_codon:yes gene_type:complete